MWLNKPGRRFFFTSISLAPLLFARLSAGRADHLLNLTRVSTHERCSVAHRSRRLVRFADRPFTSTPFEESKNEGVSVALRCPREFRGPAANRPSSHRCDRTACRSRSCSSRCWPSLPRPACVARHHRRCCVRSSRRSEIHLAPGRNAPRPLTRSDQLRHRHHRTFCKPSHHSKFPGTWPGPTLLRPLAGSALLRPRPWPRRCTTRRRHRLLGSASPEGSSCLLRRTTRFFFELSHRLLEQVHLFRRQLFIHRRCHLLQHTRS